MTISIAMLTTLVFGLVRVVALSALNSCCDGKIFVLDVFNRVWDCIVRHSYPIRHLRENLQSLEEAKRELEDISRDVESNVRRLEEQQRSRRTNQVKGWLETVDHTLKKVGDTLQRGDQEIKKRCLGNWCSKNCCSTYKLGKEVIKKLTAVKELASKGNFVVVADKLPPPTVDERPMEKTVGTEDIENIYDARNEGKYIIGSLKLACLLETGETIEIGKCYVKMHDVLRDMALWIASKQKIKILVQGYVEFSEAKSSMIKWKEAKRLSLWHLNIKAFNESPSCPNLQTFLVRDTNYLVRFPKNFFQSMRALNVLDLSRNKNLIGLPAEIGELINLQYLNLSFTSIKMLPIEIKKLTQLRILRFENTSNLRNIPAGVISCLSSVLQVFYWFSSYSYVVHHVDVSLLHELEGLERINDISLMLSSFDCIVKFFSSPKLKECVTSLRIRCPEECSSLHISSSTMRRMKNLKIIGCNSLKELKFFRTNKLPSLSKLYLKKCPIKDLTWLIHAPSLSSLTIGECPSLTEVIACSFGSSEIKEAIDIFSNLVNMTLVNLPSLKSICRQAMPFPSLKHMSIWNCPTLRNLPFNSDIVKTNCLNKVAASEEWWHKLEWEDDATKHRITSTLVAF
ncbi:hypothetical protein EZV62_004075 [Acer yangbiense]|uniref:Disease resistance R13L4/SHOC-2-like LRR domain-containing protein n=1 Tax=Acer yangbiense TaxID=1000413 RepID=A0A5C7IIN4_9ROSI|nr:hypothetical protein EZV62_004075 [Acer yangbiense]